MYGRINLSIRAVRRFPHFYLTDKEKYNTIVTRKRTNIRNDMFDTRIRRMRW